MGSLIEELRRREAGARAEADRLRNRIEELSGDPPERQAEVIAAVFDEAQARDPQHPRTWVVLVDGAEHQLGLVRAEAARRGAAINVIIDIIHVLEYLRGAAWSFHASGDPAANGDFEQYWRFHLEREQQRLYSGVKQGQYALSA